MNRTTANQQPDFPLPMADKMAKFKLREDAAMTTHNILRIFTGVLLAITVFTAPAVAQKKYDQGATDTEIKIGNIMPYTGLFSEYGAIGRAEAAYFQMINDRGGVNGRKINFVSVDSGSDTRKSVELAHKLVEQDEVLLFVSTWGASANRAIRPYMNEKKQATSLDLEIGMLRPGIRIRTSPTNYRPIRQLSLIKFNGEHWKSLGEVIGD